MIVPEPQDPFTAIADYLNRSRGGGPAQMSLQLLKVASEVGEAADAWYAHIADDPWKARTSIGDVLAELADVAVSAMVAIARLGGDPIAVVTTKAAAVGERCEEDS